MWKNEPKERKKKIKKINGKKIYNMAQKYRTKMCISQMSVLITDWIENRKFI